MESESARQSGMATDPPAQQSEEAVTHDLAEQPEEPGGAVTHESESSSDEEEFADAVEVLVGDDASATTDQQQARAEADCGVDEKPKQPAKHRGPTFRTAAQAVAAGARLRQQGQNRRARLRVMPNPPLRRTADVQGAAFILYSFTVQQWQRGASASNAWRDVHQLNVRYSSARCGDPSGPCAGLPSLPALC